MASSLILGVVQGLITDESFLEKVYLKYGALFTYSSLLLIAVLFYLFYQGNKKKVSSSAGSLPIKWEDLSEESRTAIQEKISSEIQQFRETQNEALFKLKNEIELLSEKMSSREVELSNGKLEDQAAANAVSNETKAENKISENETSEAAAKDTTENRNTAPPLVGVSAQRNDKQADQKKLYAKQPDIPNGFSTKILTPIQNGEQIYELDIDQDKATYYISEHEDARVYALSEPDFSFNKACETKNTPSKNSQIINVEKGSLAKIDGNWIIQKKAIILFD